MWSTIRPSLSYSVGGTCILRHVGVDASVHRAMPSWTQVDVFTIELTCSSERNPRKGHVVGEPRSPRGIRPTVDHSTGGISLRRCHPGIPFPRPSPLPPRHPAIPSISRRGTVSFLLFFLCGIGRFPRSCGGWQGGPSHVAAEAVVVLHCGAHPPRACRCVSLCLVVYGSCRGHTRPLGTDQAGGAANHAPTRREEATRETVAGRKQKGEPLWHRTR